MKENELLELRETAEEWRYKQRKIEGGNGERQEMPKGGEMEAKKCYTFQEETAKEC